MLEKLQQLFDRLIPTKRTTRFNARYEEPALARRVDVDRVHNIIEQAENGDTTDLFSLYRDIILSDSHLQNEFGKRKLAVLGDSLSVQPHDKEDSEDEAAAEAIDAMLGDVPGFLPACSHLLDSTLYPVAVVEKVYRASLQAGLRYELAELVPVPHRLLDFTEGCLRIWDSSPDGQRLGSKHEADPGKYIVHRGHLLSSPDNWGGPMRSLVFWWLLSVMDRDWWGRFLERFGAPFIVAKYDQADDDTRQKLEIAMSLASRLFGVVVSRQTEVELLQAAASQTGDAFEKFHTVCNREKSKLVLGQVLSSDAQPTGLGSGVAKGHQAVRDDIRQFDGTMLGATLRDQLVKQFMRINGIPGRAPRIVWSSDRIEIDGQLLSSLSSAGLELTDSAINVISDRLGFEVQRKAAPDPGLSPVLPFYAQARVQRRAEIAEAASDSIAREAAAPLAQAFRGSLAPIRRIILDSRSPAEVQQRILALYADWSPDRVQPLIEDALVAHAANGAIINAR